MDLQKCFLCLNNHFICVCDSLLYVKIEKYLQIAISDEPVYLCAVCIESIETFHEFYERIQSVYRENPDVSPSTRQLGFPSSDCNHIVGDDSTGPSFHDRDQTPDDWEVLSEYYSSTLEETKETSTICSERKRKVKHEESFDSDGSYKPVLRRKGRRLQARSTSSFYKRKLAPKTVLKVEAVERLLGQYYSNVTCPLCQEENFTLTTLDQHFRQVHEGDKSFIVCCKKKFALDDKFRLKRHLKIHLDPDSCRCDICGKTLSTPRHMRVHKQLHIPEGDRAYECEDCGKKCGGTAELYRHKYSMHTQQHAVCDICGKEFQKRVSFQAHMRQVHEEAGRTYVCLECARTYRSFASLQQHRNIAHSESYAPKTRQCGQCGKWVGAMYLKKHMMRIHSDTSGHGCPMCERVFKLPADVRSHLVTHSNERPFLCSVCGTAFKTKATLKHHLVQHMGGSPVKCEYCGKMISNNTNYIAHRKRMHPDQNLGKLSGGESQEEGSKGCEIQCEETVITEKSDLYCSEDSNNLE